MFSLRQFWAEGDNFKNVSLGIFQTVALGESNLLTNEIVQNVVYAFKMEKNEQNNDPQKTRLQLQIYPGLKNKTLYPFENTKEWLAVFFLSPINNVDGDWSIKFKTSTICNDIYVYFPPDDINANGGYIVVMVRPLETALSDMQKSVVDAIESIINHPF